MDHSLSSRNSDDEDSHKTSDYNDFSSETASTNNDSASKSLDKFRDPSWIPNENDCSSDKTPDSLSISNKRRNRSSSRSSTTSKDLSSSNSDNFLSSTKLSFQSKRSRRNSSESCEKLEKETEKDSEKETETSRKPGKSFNKPCPLSKKPKVIQEIYHKQSTQNTQEIGSLFNEKNPFTKQLQKLIEKNVIESFKMLDGKIFVKKPGQDSWTLFFSLDNMREKCKKQLKSISPTSLFNGSQETSSNSKTHQEKNKIPTRILTLE